MTFPCISKSIKSLKLLRKKKIYERLDITPWILFYSIAIAIAQGADASRWPVSPWIVVPLVGILHLLSTLFQVWSMHWKVFNTCYEVKSIDDAELIFVQPVPHSGSPAIVPIIRDTSKGTSLPECTLDGIPKISASNSTSPVNLDAWLRTSPVRFTYQSMSFHLVVITGSNEPAAFAPLLCPDRSQLSVYANWTGWQTHVEVEAAQHKWGINVVENPPPTFLALLQEQALAPFFVFQMFSVGLWMLDEYWQYSLFSLATLVGMEAMQAFSRLAQHNALRSMRPPPSPVYRLRQGRWMYVQARDLLPGDVISFSGETKSNPNPNPDAKVPNNAPTGSQIVLPVDCILISGTAVVNEAMLTGESAPVLKDSLASAVNELDEPLNAFLEHGGRTHSRYIGFAGTTLLQTTSSVNSGEDASPTNTKISPPPDNGVIAIVLRTGYQTSQGDLMRTIAHASQKVSSGNWEAFVFIAGLLVFAISAASYVLQEGWNHPRHNKYKLVLHCIMILTSVVPPELPIELALAINASIATLARRGIFCTEPFRIVFGGMVDVCVFDKTGTLTSDEFNVTGLVIPVGLCDEPKKVLEGSNVSKDSSSEIQRRSKFSKVSDDSLVNPAEEKIADVATNPASLALIAADSTLLPINSTLVLAGCHSLIGVMTPKTEPAQKNVPGSKPVTTISLDILGDPMEKAALLATGWGLSEPLPASSSDGSSHASVPMIVAPRNLLQVSPTQPSAGIRIMHQWAFSSDLKRMSTAVALVGDLTSMNANGAHRWRLLTKGAPEVIIRCLAPGQMEKFLSKFDDTLRSLASTGARILALAWKPLPAPVNAGNGADRAAITSFRSYVQHMSRAEAEKDLLFAGFLVITSPLKTDTRRTIRELQESNHRIVMATGDAALTAIAVSQQVGIVRQPSTMNASPLPYRRDAVYILEVKSNALTNSTETDSWLQNLQWTSVPMTQSDVTASVNENADSTVAKSNISSHATIRRVISNLNDSILGKIDINQSETLVHVDRVPLVSNKDGFKFTSSSHEFFLPIKPGEDTRKFNGPALCVTGPALALILQHLNKGDLPGLQESKDELSSSVTTPITTSIAADLLRYLAQHASIFARTSPDQKEAILVQINSLHMGSLKQSTKNQHFSLMCGDGTNDVGALKQAHVGVSILSNPTLEKRYDLMRVAAASKRRQDREKLINNQIAALEKLGLKADKAALEARFAQTAELDEDEEELETLVRGKKDPSDTIATTSNEDEALANAQTPEEKAAAMQAALKARFEEMKSEIFGGPSSSASGAGNKALDLDGAAAMGLPVVSLGDASMASPFTSRLPSPAACVEILRQGRCTLVATHQVYRILAVNCLILSYMLSVLHLHGVRNGDTQATIAGISMTAFFMGVSWARPMKRLSSVHPHTTVFHPHLIISVLGQFIIHLATLATLVSLCTPYSQSDAEASQAATAAAAAEAAALAANASNIAATDADSFFGFMEPESGNGGLLGLILGVRSDGSQLSSSPVLTSGIISDATKTPTPTVAAAIVETVVDEFSNIVASSPLAATATAAATVLVDAADAAMAALRSSRPAALIEVAASQGISQLVNASTTIKLPYFEDMKFAPNVINTAVFLLSTAQQACTFVINYTGSPFMQPLMENKLLWNGFWITYGVILLAATGISSTITSWLQLVVLPTWQLRLSLIGLILADVICCSALEYSLRKIYGTGRLR
jgi:predicted P-type ATPase